MRYLKQLHRHDPENGSVGDCYRTCLACLLDKDVEDVPHLNEVVPAEEFHAFYGKFLSERGLTIITVAYSGSETLEEILHVVSFHNPGMPFMVSGKSKGGEWNHIVIAMDGKVIWDPSPKTEDGEHRLVGPSTPDGFWWVDFLVRKL